MSAKLQMVLDHGKYDEVLRIADVLYGHIDILEIGYPQMVTFGLEIVSDIHKAHPDLPRRFANEGLAPTMDLAPLHERMAACARDCGRRVEVSTAGLRKSVGGYYPSPELLAAFCRAGVPVTVGSDAHRACDVGWGIRDAYAYLRATGYASVDVPRADGSWTTLAL